MFDPVNISIQLDIKSEKPNNLVIYRLDNEESSNKTYTLSLIPKS